MDRDAAQAWLDRYVEAWKSYEPEAIAALFSADVEYRYHPYDQPVAGRDAVVSSWLGEGDASPDASARDTPGTYDARYTPVASTATRSSRPGGRPTPTPRADGSCRSTTTAS